VVAASVNGSIRELDRKRPVTVGSREWAFVKDKECPALVGLLIGDAETMLDQPFPEIKNVFIPLYFRWSARQ
jgi:hypothetical protein